VADVALVAGVEDVGGVVGGGGWGGEGEGGQGGEEEGGEELLCGSGGEVLVSGEWCGLVMEG
jgi:hypothetical protein